MPILRVKSVKIYTDISVASVTNIRYAQAKFLENKIFTEKHINYDKLHSKLPILCVKSEKKIYTGQKMTNMRYAAAQSNLTKCVGSLGPLVAAPAMAKGDKTQEGGGAQPRAGQGCHRCRAQYAHTTCTIRANYAHSTTGNLSSEGARLAARHRPVAPSCTVHSAQGSLMQSHGTAQGAPTAYKILHRAAQAAPL